MRLIELEELYHRGIIEKKEYISKMYEIHDILHDYTTFLKDRDIKKIEIIDNVLIMTSRSREIKFVCPRYDERIAPIDILNFKSYEDIDSRMIFSLVKKGDVAFDIGANIGWYAALLAKSEVDVYAFEPIVQTYELLAKNIEINQLDNVRIFNFGISNTSGELIFYYYPEGSVNASTAVLNNHIDTKEIVCEVKRLDDVTSEIGINRLDFVKCDVEGAELFVFQGGTHTLEKYQPIIYTEMLRKWSAPFGYHPNDIIAFLQNFGYRCFTATNNGLVEFFHMTDETRETNFFFLHRERHMGIIDRYSR